MSSKNYKINLISTVLTSLSEQLEKISIPTSELLMVGQISALHTLSNSITEMIKHYSPSINDTITTSEIYSQLISSFSQLGKEFSLEIAKSLSSIDFSSIAKSILEIQVCKDYVNMPETFIPDDFLYEEVPDNLENIAEQDAEKSSTTKRLSLSDALNIINMIVVLLMTIIAPFWNHAVERSISKIEDAEAIAPISENQAQQMLEYLSELTNCQETILKALEASEELTPEQDSYYDNIQHLSATPDSLWIENDEFPPTSANEPNNSEQH